MYLENLFNPIIKNLSIPNITYCGIIKIQNIVVMTVDTGGIALNRRINDKLFNIPEPFRPRSLVYFSSGFINGDGSSAFRIHENGDVYICNNDPGIGAYYFTVAYVSK